MNLAQAKIQLEKIISLYKSMSADERNVSAIERDLMLNYIRQLYDVFLETPPSVSDAKPQQKTAAVSPPNTPPRTFEPPKVVEQPRTVEQPQVVVAPPPAPEPPRYVSPVIEQPRYEPPHSRPTPPSVSSSFSSDIEALFEESASKEMSHRLADTPIADLTKAFSFNDKLLTQNELFMGNKTAFDEAVKDLNNASSFDTARAFLGDLAKRNSWTATPDRQKQAKYLIKLVRRRFK